MAGTKIIYPGQLSLADIEEFWSKDLLGQLDANAYTAIDASFQAVRDVIASEKIVYGINTGFGSLVNQTIPTHQLLQLQQNIVLSHACGTGELLDDEIVALILLLKINCLAQGYSGVSRDLIGAFLAFYNHRVYPCVPAKGSVGASGDLVPLAHLALPLIAVGNMRYQGQVISAAEGLAIAGLQKINLQPKEGLALLNGLQVSLALCLQAYLYAQRLFQTAIVVGSLSIDAALASDVPFDERIQQVRGLKAQAQVAKMFRQLLSGSEIRESHRYCNRVQDPYSLRCQPQIMGAVLQQLNFVKTTLVTEINAVTDNPLVFAQEQLILSGGNFHGEVLAMAADNLALAIAEIGANAERRIALLIDKSFSGLPAFLVKDGGLNSGFMIAHVTAAACASDNKALAHPHSVDSLPTSANQEDHVSMATNAARRLFPMLDNTATILAIELMAACQGLEFHKPLRTATPLEQVYLKVRKMVAAYEVDRYLAPDITLLKEKIVAGEFQIPGLMVESEHVVSLD